MLHALIIIGGLIKARVFAWYLRAIFAIGKMPQVQRIWLFASLPFKRPPAREYSVLKILLSTPLLSE
jgi:hypothetical protein